MEAVIGGAGYTERMARTEGAEGINDKLSAPVNDQESGTCVRTYLDLGELGFYYTENVQYKAG